MKVHYTIGFAAFFLVELPTWVITWSISFQAKYKLVYWVQWHSYIPQQIDIKENIIYDISRLFISNVQMLSVWISTFNVDVRLQACLDTITGEKNQEVSN